MSLFFLMLFFIKLSLLTVTASAESIITDCLEKNKSSLLTLLSESENPHPQLANQVYFQIEDRATLLRRAEKACQAATRSENIIAFSRLLKHSSLNLSSPSVLRKADTVVPMACDQENFHEFNQDLGSSPLPQPIPKIFSLNSSIFPMRKYLTCVRSQGRRGTCSTFATVAAVEALIHEVWGRRDNLSEQFFYARTKFAWEPDLASPDHADGVSTMATVYQGAEAEGYLFLPGEVWPYNPASKRIDAGGKYTHSCDEYPSPVVNLKPESNFFCSDTNHQFQWDGVASRYQSRLPISTVYPQLPIMNGSAQIPTAADGSWIVHAESLLDKGFPLVVAVVVTDQLSQPSSLGVVESPRPGETVHNAGHAVALVGYIKNNDLPGAYPPGNGGGYFIAKNSWSTAWGDQGYGLISFEFLNQLTIELWAPGILSITNSVRKFSLETEKLTVFPNPASEFISVLLPQSIGPNEMLRVEIVDISGKILLGENKTAEAVFSVDIQSLKAGMYFMRITRFRNGAIEEMSTPFLKK